MYIENYILNPIPLYTRKKLKWLELWINKSDYIINYYNSIRGKYKIIDESIDYYIVMLEYGIYLLKDYSNYYDDIFMQHSIILDNGFLLEDVKERDFAEYLKYMFLHVKYDIDVICKIMEEGKYNYDLVVARLLFPSYYFYYFERVINDKDYDKMCDIVSRVGEYEIFLKRIVDKINEKKSKKIILPF